MDITTKGYGGYLLCLSHEEQMRKCITYDDVQELIMSALKMRPIPAGTTVSLYEGCDSVLIFVQLPRTFYCFESFEEVISACKACIAENSALYYYDEEYILSVPFPCDILSEFSDPQYRREHYELFLKEHGRTIISSNAVNFVKNTF